jgi:hypothetical protein
MSPANKIICSGSGVGDSGYVTPGSSKRGVGGGGGGGGGGVFFNEFAATAKPSPRQLLVLPTTAAATTMKLADSYQTTYPLHFACKKNSRETIMNIIASNPEYISVKDAEGKLPLHHAANRCCNLAIVEALIIPHFPESIAAQDNNGKTPEHYANLMCASSDICEALNAKRRKLRDDKTIVAMAKEAERKAEEEEWKKNNMVNAARESIEVITSALEDLKVAVDAFLEQVELPAISGPTTVTTLSVFVEVEQVQAVVRVIVGEVMEHAKTVDEGLLEGYLMKALSVPRALNGAVASWAAKLKEVVKRNASYTSNDSVSKVLTLLALVDPLGPPKGGQLEQLEQLIMVLGWRFKKMLILVRQQEYYVKMGRLHELYKQRAWDSSEEQAELTQELADCINEVDVSAHGDRAKDLTAGMTKVCEKMRGILQGDLKEMRMMKLD